MGVVTGDYEYTPQVPAGVRSDYVHKLPVTWLVTGLDFNILELNRGVQLTLKAVYHLWRIQWPDLLAALRHQGITFQTTATPSNAAAEPYLLIIDEINRGNISKIFGELITLIEQASARVRKMPSRSRCRIRANRSRCHPTLTSSAR